MSVLEKLYATPAGKFVAQKAGLAEPPVLRRGRAMPTGPVVLGELDGGGLAASTLAQLGVVPAEALLDVPEARTKDEKGRDVPPRYPTKPGAVVVDATGVREIAQLEGLRRVLRPAMRSLE
ncbi:MAG TPA: hypothetical protein VLQ67_12075, partial [Arachnia sp.]|nr:hypothetical protein [Arachnia sp.]